MMVQLSGKIDRYLENTSGLAPKMLYCFDIFTWLNSHSSMSLYQISKFIFVALLCQVSAVVVTLSAQESNAPNVLFIAIDDLNDWVGVLEGHPQSITPNIDRLAERGILFTNAHCQAPICQPSRTSLLTGTYPFSNGVYDVEQNMRDAPLVKDAGQSLGTHGGLAVYPICQWR